MAIYRTSYINTSDEDWARAIERESYCTINAMAKMSTTMYTASIILLEYVIGLF